MLDSLKAWYNQPFSEEMDATQWFLFFGLIIAISIIWGIILRHVINKAF